MVLGTLAELSPSSQDITSTVLTSVHEAACHYHYHPRLHTLQLSYMDLPVCEEGLDLSQPLGS